MQQRLDSLVDRIDDPFAQITSRPTAADPTDDASPEVVPDPVTFLILGSDSRTSSGDPAQWERGAQRTDAIMVAQVSGDRQHVSVMSIPRDSWVNVPGDGMNKINAAYSYGGPSLMIQTVEELTGIYIDHFAVTDFESFSAMTENLGGVSISLSEPLNVNGTWVATGVQRLNGEQALAYVQQRYNLSGGDFSRVQRQQNWVRSIMTEVFQQDILSDLGRLTGFLQTVAKSVALDEGVMMGTLTELAVSVRGISPENVQFMTAPYAGISSSADGQSIVLLDEAKSQALFGAFASDAVAQFLAANGAGIALLPTVPE